MVHNVADFGALEARPVKVERIPERVHHLGPGPSRGGHGGERGKFGVSMKVACETILPSIKRIKGPLLSTIGVEG